MLVLVHLSPLVRLSMDPVQFPYQTGIGVDGAVIYLPHRSLTHLAMAGSTVKTIFLINQCFQYLKGQASEGQVVIHQSLPNYSSQTLTEC